MLSMPGEVIIVDNLPFLASGKIDYVTLKAMATEEKNG
jgi:acyl-coenzyme A synthetase/AMP-(fatty) acid ligase